VGHKEGGEKLYKKVAMNHYSIFKRVMIEHHLKIQLFTTLIMCQGGPHLNLFLKNKKTPKVVGNYLDTYEMW
jgi:hypothetical protein